MKNSNNIMESNQFTPTKASEPSQSQPQGQKPKSTVAIVGILLGIAVVLLVVYVILKKNGGNDEPIVNRIDSSFRAEVLNTSKWETLRVPSYGLSIKYPTEFVVTETDQDYVSLALRQNYEIEAVNTLSVSILNNSKMLSLDEWFLQTERFMNKQEFDKVPKRENAGGSAMEEEKRNIAGKEVITQRDYSEGGEGLATFVSNGNTVIRLYTFFPSSVYGSLGLNKNVDIGYLDVNKYERMSLKYLRQGLMEDILFQVVEELK